MERDSWEYPTNTGVYDREAVNFTIPFEEGTENLLFEVLLTFGRGCQNRLAQDPEEGHLLISKAIPNSRGANTSSGLSEKKKLQQVDFTDPISGNNGSETSSEFGGNSSDIEGFSPLKGPGKWTGPKFAGKNRQTPSTPQVSSFCLRSTESETPIFKIRYLPRIEPRTKSKTECCTTVDCIAGSIAWNGIHDQRAIYEVEPVITDDTVLITPHLRSDEHSKAEGYGAGKQIFKEGALTKRTDLTPGTGIKKYHGRVRRTKSCVESRKSMMELPSDDIIKQGYIKFRGKNLGIWKKQWVVLRKSSSRGGRRLECYNDDKTARNNNKCEKIIELADLVQIQGLPPDIKKFGVSLMFRDKSSKTFCCDSDDIANKWMRAIEELCLRPRTVNSVDLLQSGPSQKEFTELFNVYLVQTPTLAVYGECLLQVTQEHIHVLDNLNPGKRLVSWPLNALRRYGSDTTKFTFESGRFCDTGEGIFIFNTTDGESIYQKVHSATVAIAEMHRIVHMARSDRVVNRGQSVPVPCLLPQHVTATRSKSVPTGNAPEPPPRPKLFHPFSTSGEVRSNSALNSPLPPVPQLTSSIDSIYLNSADYDEYNPPSEYAPAPPTHFETTPIRAGMSRDMFMSQYPGGRQAAEEYYSAYPNIEERTEAEGRGVSPPSASPISTNLTETGPEAPQQRVAQITSSGIHDYINQRGEKEERSQGEEDDDTEDYEAPEYIYAEKGLTQEFRKYLKERKEEG